MEKFETTLNGEPFCEVHLSPEEVKEAIFQYLNSKLELPTNHSWLDFEKPNENGDFIDATIRRVSLRWFPAK